MFVCSMQYIVQFKNMDPFCAVRDVPFFGGTFSAGK